MASTFLAWLASSGASLILGFLAQVIKDYLADSRSAQAQRDLGAAQVTSMTNKATVETQDAMANVPRPSDSDIAGRLSRHEF